MEGTILIVSLLIASSVSLIFYSFLRGDILTSLSDRRRMEKKILERIEEFRPEEIRRIREKMERKERELVSPSTVRVVRNLMGEVSFLNNLLFSEGVLSNVDRWLLWAGRPNNLDAPSFIVIWILLGCVGVMVSLFFSLVFGGSNKMVGFLGALLGIFVGVSPWYWLKQQVRKRQDSILSDLPNKLDLMRVCIEAGMTIDASIERLAQGDNPIDEELRRLAHDLSLARNLEEKRQAYWGFSARCGLPEVEQVVQFLLHAQEIGQPPGETLQRLSEMARMNRQSYLSRVIEVLPNKIVFPLVCCFLPAFFLVFVTPMFLKLLQSL